MKKVKIYSRKELASLFPRPDRKVLINLGCGKRKLEGYIGVDVKQMQDVDIVCDLEKGLPFDDNAVDEITSNFFVEHVANKIHLFKEMYRVCAPEAVVSMRVPFYQSFTQYKDPTHKSIILPEMIPYFSDNKFYGSDYGIDTNFKILDVTYAYLPPWDKFFMRRFWPLRPILFPILKFARRNLWNVVHSINLKLQVKK